MIELIDDDELRADVAEKGIRFVDAFTADIKVVDVAIRLDQLCCQRRFANPWVATNEVVATRLVVGETSDRIEDKLPAYKVMRLLLNEARVVTNLLADVERRPCECAAEVAKASCQELSEISQLQLLLSQRLSRSCSPGGNRIEGLRVKGRTEHPRISQFDLQILKETLGFRGEVAPWRWIIH